MNEKLKKIGDELGAGYLIDSLIDSSTDLALTALKAKKEVTSEISKDFLSNMLSVKVNIDLIIESCGIGEALKKMQEEGLEVLYEAVVKEGENA